MGCVTSTLLNRDEDFPQIGASAAFSHHIVSLTSTTYGLLTLDPTPPPPPASNSPPHKDGGSLRYNHPPLETINSWDLMSGLDENESPNIKQPPSLDYFLEGFELICPPKGENRVVMYSTSLRGVRKTFEDCNAVRSAIQGLGVAICERDISMDRGFRDELRELMKGKEAAIPPRVFVNGRYVGGAEEVMKIAEEGYIGKLVEGLPKLKGGFGNEQEDRVFGFGNERGFGL
ncbi:hypothetical protein ACS0TY_000908 [Phlomoides rotata]